MTLWNGWEHQAWCNVMVMYNIHTPHTKHWFTLNGQRNRAHTYAYACTYTQITHHFWYTTHTHTRTHTSKTCFTIASDDPKRSVEPGFFRCSSSPPAPGATVFLRSPNNRQYNYTTSKVCSTSYYLQYPIHAQFGQERQRQRDLLMGGTEHTSHSDCVLLVHCKEIS